MDPSPDELAGVVDCFGALSREALQRALSELAYKRGVDVDPGTFADDVEAAVASYHLVVVEDGEEDVVAVGPAAFPVLPDGAADLLHIMPEAGRNVDREAVARTAADRFRADAERAIATGDDDRIDGLIDVSYELSTWGAVDVSATRERLVEAAE